MANPQDNAPQGFTSDWTVDASQDAGPFYPAGFTGIFVVGVGAHMGDRFITFNTTAGLPVGQKITMGNVTTYIQGTSGTTAMVVSPILGDIPPGTPVVLGIDIPSGPRTPFRSIRITAGR